MSRAVPVLAWSLLFVWALLASCFPVASFDIWVHMQVGLDVLRTGGLPSVDTYSWTATGRPFVAHEWLAGVVLALVAGPTEGHGLTIVRMWGVGLVVVCAALALPADERRSPLALALTGATLVLVISRALVRPHLFSLVFVAALVATFAGWRASRRPLVLAWLVPLTALWANLHGAFLLAPALLVALGAGAALAALSPSLSPGDREHPYTLRQAAQPFVVAALCLVAALSNPYGAALFAFSFEMGTGNDYIKALILEWLPPWHPDLRGAVDPWLFALYLAVTGAALVLARRRLSLVDVALLGALLVQALSATRFVADFALFAAPITTSWLAPSLRARLEGRRGTTAALCLVVPLALLAFTLARGPSFRTGAELDFSTGFVRAPAADMVKHLHDLGYQGGVFNEYEDGGYLVYAGKGRIKPVIDARIDIYGADLVEAWKLARLDPALALTFLDHYHVGAVLLHDGKRPHDAHERALVRTGRWRVERRERGYLLLLRTPRSFAAPAR